MAVIEINGGVRLSGEAVIHGAKNSALPMLAACAAVQGCCRLENCPALTDVNAAVGILRYIGCRTEQCGTAVCTDASELSRFDIPEHLMREMRSSISFLGAVLARFGRAEISLPGGCELGARPVDIHLSALEKMGAAVQERHGIISCRCNGRMKGAAITLSFPSVGATENIMTAAATAEGTTIINNAAREPEITDLGNFLTCCGARISGCGSSTIIIDGVERLHGCTYTIMPDRIEAATYMAAAAITGGKVLLRQVVPEHIQPVTSVLEKMGCRIHCTESGLLVDAPRRLRPAGTVRTMPYPGFPTDAQAIIMAVTCVAEGTSVFVENIFDSRFKHVGELCRLGARITTEGRAAVVEGAERLTGASVTATDLRGAAALAVAGLVAEGTTTLSGLNHLDRGYENLEEGLAALGASVIRR
ncbi:MAG: UDP-N-acetylglucosamine 1-carboxyvinyltransferase [Ruminococcaceae bacterium]|nr:UDP-N-acetylglucosamine 1-carboxyvinyltransferase [Oscillospiraceae bacterium]